MPARCQVSCPGDPDLHSRSDRSVVLDGSAIVIDDEEQVYRFTCPECGGIATKRMDDEIREMLRLRANVPTIEELVESGAAALTDDEYIWRAMKKV